MRRSAKSTSCVSAGITGSLAEGYRKAVMEIGFIFATEFGKGVEYVAIFEWKLGIGDAPLDENVALSEPYSRFMVRRGYRDEQLVFIGDVETVETPEGVAPSTVRLQSANEFYRICGRAIDPSDTAGLKIGPIRTYWESCVVARGPAASPDKSDRKQVEGRPEIVDTVPEHGSPLVGDYAIHPEAVHFVTRNGVFVNDPAPRLSRLESADGRIKVRKVCFGPVNLYPDAVQRFRHDQIRSDERP
jgi:hypothetical protein